jgi:hypothetical protein
VARINSLRRDEAIEVSSFLHAQLRFRIDSDGVSIVPYALTSDVIDVCNGSSDTRSGALRAVCDRALSYVDGGERSDIGVQFTREEASALAPLLNDLYGIL